MDTQELAKRIIKYVLEGVTVAFAAIVLPKKGVVDMEAAFTLALVAAATFAILDMFAPNVGASARTGAGFGIGANLVGFPA